MRNPPEPPLLACDVLVPSKAEPEFSARGIRAVCWAEARESDDSWVARGLVAGANLFITQDCQVLYNAQRAGCFVISPPSCVRRRMLVRWIIEAIELLRYSANPVKTETDLLRLSDRASGRVLGSGPLFPLESLTGHVATQGQ